MFSEGIFFLQIRAYDSNEIIDEIRSRGRQGCYSTIEEEKEKEAVLETYLQTQESK